MSEVNIFEVPSLLETAINEHERVILFGEPKTGKTMLAGLLAEFFNVLWFDGDKGLSTLKNNLPPELLKRIRAIRIPDNTDYPLMCGTMLRLLKGVKYLVCITHGTTDCPICKVDAKAIQVPIELNKLPANWVAVMDSQTQFYASVLAFAYYKDTGKATGLGIPDDYKGNWDYRGIAYQMCDKFGNYMKDLQCQWVSISHETMTEMEDGVSNKIVPIGGSKNISSQYGKWFGSMVYAKKVNNKHNFISGSLYSSSVQTGSRSGIALEKKEVPSLIHLFRPKEAEELLKGSFNEWWLLHGYKDIKDRPKGKELPPKPKEVIAL